MKSKEDDPLEFAGYICKLLKRSVDKAG